MFSCEGIDVDPNRRLLIEGQILANNQSEIQGFSIEYLNTFSDLPQRIRYGLFFVPEFEPENPAAFRNDENFAVLGFDLLDANGNFRITSLESRGSRSLGINLPGSDQYDSSYATLIFADYLYPLSSNRIEVPATTLDRVLTSELQLARLGSTADTLDVSIRYASYLQAVYISGEGSELRVSDSFRLLPGEASRMLEFITREGTPLELFYQRRNGGVIEEQTLTINPDTNQIYRYEHGLNCFCLYFGLG